MHQQAKIMGMQSWGKGKNNDEETVQSGDRIDIVFYTDPLCCWSWAMEPQWRRIQYEYRDLLSIRYCMGGLLSDWNNFNDSINSVSRPIQMGPVWAEAKHISGMPVYDRIWMSDPPATSYTACVAVKCAGLQSTNAEEKFLRKCREELMINGVNIARQSSLFSIAEKLAAELDDFSADKFKQDYQSGAGAEAFKDDLKEVRFKNINRFPTLKLNNKSGKAILLSGYKSYKSLKKVFNELLHLPSGILIKQEDYQNYFGCLMEREIEEAIKLYP